MILLGPDPELTRHFGNEDVLAEKRAGRAELATRITMGLIGYGMGRTELSRQRAHQAEAEAMNATFERLQAMKMQAAQENARFSRPPMIIPAPVHGMSRWDGDSVPVGMDMGMVRMASVATEVGVDMAKQALDLSPILAGAKSVMGKLGPMASKLVGPKTPSLAGAVQAATGAVPKPPPAIGQASSALAAGAGAQNPVGGALSGLADKAKKMWEQSGVNTMGGAKRTAIGLGLGAAALYGGGKALRKGLNVMSREAPPSQFGAQSYGGSTVPYGVNEYGQPDLRAPFM